MRLDAIAIGKNPPEEVNVVIEVAIGGEPIKYEMDKEAGTLFVDRFLYTPMRYPGNYGFIPHTLSEDGDPCDVLVANTRPLVPGSYIAVRPIGVMMMEDEGGGDEKIIAVPVPKLTKRYENVTTYTDLPQITLDQIQLTDSMIALAQKEKFFAVRFDGDIYDTGSKIGFLSANVAYALERGDLGPQLRADIERLLKR